MRSAPRRVPSPACKTSGFPPGHWAISLGPARRSAYLLPHSSACASASEDANTNPLRLVVLLYCRKKYVPKTTPATFLEGLGFTYSRLDYGPGNQNSRRLSMSVEKIARKCLIGLALAGLLATGAWAQSDDGKGDLKSDTKDVRKDRKDLRKDRKDIRNDQKDLNKDRIDRNKDRRDLSKDQKDLAKDRRDLREDIKEGDKADAAKDRADIRKDQKDVNKDRKDLRSDNRDIHSDKKDLHADRKDARKDRKDIRKDRRDIRHDKHGK